MGKFKTYLISRPENPKCFVPTLMPKQNLTNKTATFSFSTESSTFQSIEEEGNVVYQC